MEAKEIRKRIKDELGLNNRQVSVRGERCTYSWAIRVTIKVPVAKSKIEAIAKSAESIRRCEYSGEILSGGNTYVSVEYGEGVLDSFFDEEALKALEATPGKGLEMPGGFEIYYLEDTYNVVKPNAEGYSIPTRCWGPQAAGRAYAELLLEDKEAAKEAA